MSGITLKPILGCNLKCVGCYEGKIFESNDNRPEPYDLEAVRLASRGGPAGQAVLHGGEPLLMSINDMRILCEELAGQKRPISIQTNLTFLRDEHVQLFRDFRVSVGVSLNGPGEMNRDRTTGNDASTDRMTERIHGNIAKLREANLSVSIICVLSKTNVGTADRTERIIAWAADMGNRIQVWSFRFNPLFNGGDAELSEVEARDAYLLLCRAAFEDPRRQWLPFREMVDNLWGLGLQPCWLGHCDPYSTEAVHAILADGSVGNCLRTAQDGIAYLQAQRDPDMRDGLLTAITMEQGGCGGCRYWRVCHGGCPAEGVDGDWRNRTRFCQMYYGTYGFIERRLQGILPNWTPVPDWTTNNEEGMARGISQRKPLTSAVNPLDPAWSVSPSTWTKKARTRKTK